VLLVTAKVVWPILKPGVMSGRTTADEELTRTVSSPMAYARMTVTFRLHFGTERKSFMLKEELKQPNKFLGFKSVCELHRPKGRRLFAKLMPNSADKACRLASPKSPYDS
jgi:hypothetical protein